MMFQTDIRGRRPALGGVVLFHLGFRPFFLGASLFAVLSIAAWAAVYLYRLPLPLAGLTSFQWHAHEMIYGYGLAVIAGFLLTAVSNWTGRRTIHGLPLLGLFGCWAGARLLMLFGTAMAGPAALLDLLFVSGLAIAVAVPICRAGQWKQIGIVAKLLLIGAGGAVFHLGLFGHLASGVHWGIYGGLYLVIGLILTMGRRVIPSFIERGVGYPVTLFNNRWVDIASLLLFLALFLAELFPAAGLPGAPIAAALFAVNMVRLAGWHTPGIWRKPLLWSLYLAYAFIVVGFGLLALSGFAGTSRFAALHALAYGGIGLVTMSMMARVSLGHTGRDVHNPPRTVALCCGLLAAGTMLRVLMPLLLPGYYVLWIGLSQLAWMAAFTGLAVLLFPILTAPRPDGRPG